MAGEEGIRHFTVTGFLVAGDTLALHWHPRVGAWLPPGGHVEINEDPVQAVQREINEETGLDSVILPTRARFPFAYPPQIEAPLAILIEDVVDERFGTHQHIDLVYVCRPLLAQAPLPKGWLWVSSADLAAGGALLRRGEGAVAPPLDVRQLASTAFELASA